MGISQRVLIGPYMCHSSECVCVFIQYPLDKGRNYLDAAVQSDCTVDHIRTFETFLRRTTRLSLQCKNIRVSTDILWRAFHFSGTGSVYVCIRKSTE